MKKIIGGVLLFSILLVLVSLYFEIRQVRGTNMEPTIKDRQTVLVKKFLLGAPAFKRSEIVFYYPKNTEVLYIGRVVGLPKELIRIEKGNLYLDDNVRKYQLIEEYLSQNTKTTSYKEGEWFKIGDFEYFITGDNREDKPINIENSIVHKDNIKGKLVTKF